MHRKRRSFCIAVTAVIAAGLVTGCTGVEKRTKVQEGAAIGGALGTIIGAGAGHASALGGGPGALVGLSLGATAGALTTGYYYDDPDAARLDAEQLEALQKALDSREKEVSALESKVQQSEAKKRALMEAHQQMQREMQQLKEGLGKDAALSAHTEGTYKVTILGDVMFESGRANITSGGKSILARAARQIREQFPNAYIEIRGHTDNEPIRHSDWKSNWELSSARAVSVLHYLVEEQGFNEMRIRTVGFSDTRPVASNDTAEGRRKNRRAEIVIIPHDSRAAREFELN